METARTKAVVKRLVAHGRMAFIEGATEEQIEAFERKYDMVLPERHKEWLRFSDGGELFLPAGVQLYGVAHKPMIDTADDNRPSERYVVIGAMASGDPILFERGTENVAIFNREAWQIEEGESYKDFFAFVNDLYEILWIED